MVRDGHDEHCVFSTMEKWETLPPTNMAPLGGYLEDWFPLQGTMSGAILVGGRVHGRSVANALFIRWQVLFLMDEAHHLARGAPYCQGIGKKCAGKIRSPLTSRKQA